MKVTVKLLFRQIKGDKFMASENFVPKNVREISLGIKMVAGKYLRLNFTKNASNYIYVSRFFTS